MSNTVKELTFSNKLDTENFMLNGVGNPEKTSKRYRGVSSQAMIDSFEEVGYQVRSISRPMAQIKSNLAFNKHIIRLATNDSIELLKKREVGLDFPEIVIVNNNNNRGSLQVLLGVFRLVCSNGMILGDNFYNAKVRHNSNFGSNLLTALIAASEKYHTVTETISRMKSLELSSKELLDYRVELSKNILEPLVSNKNTTKVRIISSLNPVRQEDMKKDLWTTFNRYQEHIVRNGIQFSRIDNVFNKKTNTEDHKIINGTTREIRGSDRLIKVNQKIMNFTLDHFNIAA